MQRCSGDETSRWEISEPERTCWLTATLDTLAKARTHRKKELLRWRIPLANTLIPLSRDQDDTRSQNLWNMLIKDWQLVIQKKKKLWVTWSFTRREKNKNNRFLSSKLQWSSFISSLHYLLFGRQLSALCGGNGAAVETQRFNVSDRIRVEALPCSKTHSEEAALHSHKF